MNNNKFNIVADENIPFVKEAFASFGKVKTISGREMKNSDLKNADILVVRSVTKVNRELLDATPVKFVGTATIGTDHIDKVYLHENSIGFAYAPGSNAISVAEYVIAAILEMQKMRKLCKNPVLGIIGVGNVGSELFKRAQAMGIKIILNDPPKKRLTKSELFRPIDELLKNADVVSLHVPLHTSGADATYHLVDSNFISSMKKGATLINSSRGDVIDEKALLSHVSQLGGIVLDVWHNEPNINCELLKLVDIATPHIAGYSWNGKIRGTQMVQNSASAFFFMKDEWSAETILSKEPIISIIAEEKSLFYSVVSQAYSINTDDNLMRLISKLEKERFAIAFDDMRKKYFKRLEFCHYAIEASNLNMNAFAGLGFKSNLSI